MCIAPISYSSRSTAVIVQAIEVGSKPFKSILSFEVSVTRACMNKLHCIPCLLFVLKIVHVINFRGFHYPRKIFNNEIFFQTTVFKTATRVLKIFEFKREVGIDHCYKK